MDEESLQAGSGAWAKMQAKLRGARRVLAVLSPRYQESWWCVLRCAVVGLIEVFTMHKYDQAVLSPGCYLSLNWRVFLQRPSLCCDWALGNHGGAHCCRASLFLKIVPPCWVKRKQPMSARRCLEELRIMAERREAVMPIFYDVQPGKYDLKVLKKSYKKMLRDLPTHQWTPCSAGWMR